jgi:Protein of unknown function (DUF3800)
MDLYIDESGNTGDIASTEKKLDFGGQPVFSLAAIGVKDESSLANEFMTLRQRHNVQSSELKLSKVLRRKPKFALDTVCLLVESDAPFFIEVVDKKYQLAVSITNNFVWPPYFNTPETQSTVWLNNIFADYIYHHVPDAVHYDFVQCMRQPSNEMVGKYFDVLKAAIIASQTEVASEIAQGIAENIEESKDDFRLMIEREGDQAYRRFLPIPDISKRNKEVCLLPNFSSFTNIYARMNLYLLGRLKGSRIYHDEQAQFDEIIEAAKEQVEKFDANAGTFRPPHSNYHFREVASLCFKTSTESTGIQLADIVAGLCMRWYQAHLQKESDTKVLDNAIECLLRRSDPSKGVGINVVGPHQMALQLFGVDGY